ncbi:hypothetical protein [Clostridium vincentii]|uniref:Uncharacterized protein n=1 Tax=Clostridium vincentii TaxID=52704 RepID=A0A2T0BCS9_9CLOT|nr:hypothetical protein [Clostridium vincentii]PRR81688.1 hypothetical protein CLVI_22970 [Clostridium vincentii]
MKKRRIIKKVFILIIVCLIILASPFIIWSTEPSKNLNVLIINKTVPDNSYREHKGFMWILNNLKITNGDSNTSFEYDNSYYGFFPLADENYSIKDLPEEIINPNLIYMADTYGVYKEDFYKNNLSRNKSEIIYGGTKVDEVEKIKKSLNDNTIIGEFNTLTTTTDVEAKEALEDIFGLKSNDWIGRYFSDLSETNIEITSWMKENYAMEYGLKWSFKGAGIVLVNSKSEIIVLRKGVELGKELNKVIFTDNAQEEFKVKNKLNYYYWFEITQSDKDTDVLAKYKLDVTEEGQALMKKYDLPVEFPAITRKKGNYTSYYFSGDFADNNSIPKVYNAAGMRFFNKITTFDEDTNQDYFYWNVYYPLIENIIKNIN